MKKAETLDIWRKLPENQDPLPFMIPLQYKAKGSTYGACGIRIDGNPAFIEAVLSNLKTLINGENNVTRLGLARNRVNGSAFDKNFENQADKAEVCYIRLHERGSQGAIVAGIFHDHDKETEEYAKAIGL